MPSSLAVIHSSTSGYSPRPPVSVCGTGRAPLGASAIFLPVWLPALSDPPWGLGTVGDRLSPTPLQPGIPSPGGSVTPGSRFGLARGYRNLDRLYIALPLRVPLSPRLTLNRLALFRKPWACGVRGSLAHLVTHAYIFFSGRSSIPPGTPSLPSAMLPYRSSRSPSLRRRTSCPFIIHASPLD